MSDENCRRKGLLFRDLISGTLWFAGGMALFGIMFGFVAVLLLASNAIDPIQHYCRKGEPRSIILLDSRARAFPESSGATLPVQLTTSEYVTANARITTKSFPHQRVGSIPKPAVLFKVTVAPDAPPESKHTITARFASPDFSKTIFLTVTDADERWLSSMDKWWTVWTVIKYGWLAYPGVCLLLFLALKFSELRDEWEAFRSKTKTK